MNDGETTVEMSCADAVWSMLREEGVDRVFGVCGITNVPLLHALRRASDMTFVHATHESAALGMADGYSRATGRLAVVVVHSTGGLSNTMGNLHNAYAAGSRILVIVGQTDASLDWNERYMDVDVRPMVSQVTKARWRVTRANDVAVAVNRAIKEACTAPTGPVVLSIPHGVQCQVVAHQSFPAHGRRVTMDTGLSAGSLEHVGRLLASARNPVIVAGHAVADTDAVSELVALAEVLAAPVYTGNETKLIFPSDHPLYRGLLFQQSHAIRRVATSADVLLEIGSDVFKFDDQADSPVVPPATRVIQIDLDACALARFCPTEVALLANPKLALAQLRKAVEPLLDKARHVERMAQLREEHQQRKDFVESCLNADPGLVPVHWGAAFREIAAALPGNAAVVDELASFYGQLPKVIGFREPGSYFTCVDSLGWGVPAALGVAMGCPDKAIVALLGDGGAMFCIQALWSAARYQVPIVFVVFNNGGFGSMRGLFGYYGQAVGAPMDGADCAVYDIGELSFAALAEGFGLIARRISDAAAIKPALEEMIGLRKPTLIELMVSPEGAGLNEMTAAFFS